jgi:hypothetical protein
MDGNEGLEGADGGAHDGSVVAGREKGYWGQVPGHEHVDQMEGDRLGLGVELRDIL